MSVNSSVSSGFGLMNNCSDLKVSHNMSIAFVSLKSTLTMPLCILVLFLGHRRWRRQRSFKTTSHSDMFTLHMAAMELMWVFGCIWYLCGLYANLPNILIVGVCSSSIVFYGEALFHILTCVERYLAVVHPITYLSLKTVRGVRIRNISIGCAWLLSFGFTGVTYLYLPDFPTIPFLCLLVFSLLVTSFCSIAVLCVLIRPGPREGGGAENERVDQSKQKAFHTVTAIMGLLWLWFLGLIVAMILFDLKLVSEGIVCVLMNSVIWFNLPSSLVLPVLYLHRAGKLQCRCYNNE